MSVWMTDGADSKAYVDEDDIDTWKARGWRESAEPSDGERVWLAHEDHGGRQLFPASVVPIWQQLGWHPSAPANPLDVLKDPVLIDQSTGEGAAEESAKAAKTTKAVKPATSEKE